MILYISDETSINIATEQGDMFIGVRAKSDDIQRELAELDVLNLAVINDDAKLEPYVGASILFLRTDISVVYHRNGLQLHRPGKISTAWRKWRSRKPDCGCGG